MGKGKVTIVNIMEYSRIDTVCLGTHIPAEGNYS